MALITVFMVLMIASALMVGFFATIVADQRENGIDRDQTQAYAAAHAGLEKLTSAMASLFVTDYSPSKAQIDAIIAKPPIIPGFTYTAPGGAVGSGYAVTYTADTTPGVNFGNPVPDTATGTPITAGPYAGFKGIITKYPITITARSSGGAEVRLRRELQTVAVPVYQFGVFSETDLTFYAGDDFNFGGRVQTNGNLFLSELTGKTLTLADRVTAYKEVVRANLSNGLPVSSVFFTGTVNVLDTVAPGHYRALAETEGSVTGMPSSAGPPAFTQTLNTNWTTISTSNSYYKSLLRNGLTGAKYLSLPLVSQGAYPIDLIRRPVPPVAPAVLKEDVTNPLVYGQRYFSMASLRILLSDTAAEITGLPVTATAPLPLDLAATYGVPVVTPNHRSPMATSPGLNTTAGNFMTVAAGSTLTTVNVVGPGLPAYFKLPNLTVNGVAGKTCNGRTANTFTGCAPTPAVAVLAGSPISATLGVNSGIGLTPAATTLSAAWIVGSSTITVPADATAPFAPTVFWLHAGTGAPAVTNGEPFTCSSFDNTPRLFNCTGLSAIPPAGAIISTGALEVAGTPLNRGFIKIELQNNATPPVWTDVTAEILRLGISGPPMNGPVCDPTPNAIVRLQHLRDNVGGICTVAATGNSSINSNDYWPNVLYDTREGTYRDDPPDPTDHNLALGGMMNYVALDVGNLKKWLEGTAPYNAAPYLTVPAGTTANTQNNAGFIVYFSDRRNNKCPVGNVSCPVAVAAVETGEYGVEDFVNPLSGTGLPPSGAIDVGEDVNAIIPVAPAVYAPVLDMYGQLPVSPTAPGFAAGVAGSARNVLPHADSIELTGAKRPWDVTRNQWVGMVNRPVFFRRALKLVNGGNPLATSSNLPSPGLSVASENPVYVQGNYNATVGSVANGVEPAETHMAASILADAVTLLSNAWNDSLSFQWPNDAPSRPATSTAYRFAVVSGKSLSFPYPTTGTPQFLYGTDGGVGNFLRLLEDWRVPVAYVRYRGSIVSLFISRQALGTFKYSTRVYDFATRKFSFDDDFLLPAKLPPGTPMFRDVNTLTFRQLLRPNQ